MQKPLKAAGSGTGRKITFLSSADTKTRSRLIWRANPHFVRPEFRRQEILAFLETVEDISVSRSRKAVGWGIPVPDDPDQVTYVWIDALSNYVTGAGYLTDDAHYQQFWPTDVHVIGKDILRFHAVYWPAMLLSADLPLPKNRVCPRLYYH